MKYQDEISCLIQLMTLWRQLILDYIEYLQIFKKKWFVYCTKLFLWQAFLVGDISSINKNCQNMRLQNTEF